MAGIDILSINVHGLRDPVKCSNVVDWLKTRKESIVFLQETYFSEPDGTDFLKSIWKGPTFSSFGGKHSRGVSTLIKESLSAKRPRVTHDNCGRGVNVILDTNDSTLQLLNIYAPCPIGERTAFFQTLPPHIRGEFQQSSEVILIVSPIYFSTNKVVTAKQVPLPLMP